MFASGRAGICAVAMLCLVGCGGGDPPQHRQTDEVRTAVAGYLRTLEGARWSRACELMTKDARRELGAAIGDSCARALGAGLTLPRDQIAAVARELPGARVRVVGARATVGPFEGLGRPLRLERVAGRWLVAS